MPGHAAVAKTRLLCSRRMFAARADFATVAGASNREAAMSEINLRHGIFLPPFHPNEEDPTQCLERDLELMVWLDKLGFHEAWIGEHHSAGYETVSSPEIFIAIAAERTKFIRFDTGVISLPYHHPLMAADR